MRVVVIHDSRCTLSKDTIVAELKMRQLDADIEVLEPTDILRGDWRDNRIATFVACHFLNLAALKRFDADIYISCLRNVDPVLGDDDHILVDMPPHAALAFILWDGGGGILKRVEDLDKTHDLPDTDTVSSVFEMIVLNAQGPPSE